MTHRDTESANKSGQRAGGQASDATAKWNEHEHVAENAKIDAQKLVDTAGSPELAKQAIDAASNDNAKDKDALAAQLGFDSYLDMFESSTIVTAPSGETFYITGERSGAWAVWSERTLDTGKRFKTMDDAEQFIRRHNEEAMKNEP